MNIREKIKTFLQEDPFFSGNVPEKISDEFNLINAGILDSIGIFYLISFIESEFSLKIDMEDLSDEYFKSILTIEKMILNKKNVH